MTDDRREFLALRKLGVGGSDQADVFSDKPEGCARRLGYDKLDVPPDYPIIETGQMKLGSFLEAFVAREYQSMTGRVVETVPEPVVGLHHRWMRVNVDRLITVSDRDSVGVLEIKTHGSGLFRKVRREGLKAAHLRQLQHGIHVTEKTWGAFAVLDRDTGEMIHFDVDRDPELIEQLVSESRIVWEMIQRGRLPDPLPIADARCLRCAWRITCRGTLDWEANVAKEHGDLEVDNGSLADGILDDYADALALAEEATTTLEAVKDEIRTRMGERGAVEVPNVGRIYYRPQPGRRGVDTEMLEKKFPDVWKAVQKRTKPSRPLKIYIR